MRKIVLILCFCLLASPVVFAGPVNPQRAAKVAQHFFNVLPAAKGGVQLQDVSNQWQFGGIYLFTSPAGGYVLVAADDAIRPILGYSPTGTIDPANMPPVLQQWLQAYQQEIEAIQNAQVSALNSQFSSEWHALENNLLPKDDFDAVVGPLITTFWDQTYPYNGYCPGGSAVGCAATAQAQVMNFWQYPAFGMGNHSYTHSRYGVQSADFAHTLYDWDHMPVMATNNSSVEEKEAVAMLMYHCGVSLEMAYDPNGSAAAGLAGMEGIPSIDNSLKDYFGYSTSMRVVHREYYTKDMWRNLLIADLDQGRPIVYVGSGDAGGHGFVCDGYDSRGYLHFNFGWSSRGDGYFPVDSISPGVGGVGGNGTYTFNQSNAALLGLVPDYRMRVSDTIFSIERSGGEDSLLFCINESLDAPWSMTCFDSNGQPVDWLTLSAANIVRAGWIHFSVSENTVGQERVAFVTFTQGDEQRTVRVVQVPFDREELCPLIVVMESTRGEGWQGGAYLSFESPSGFVYGTAQLTSAITDSVEILVAPDQFYSVFHSGGGTDRYINYAIKKRDGETLLSVNYAYRNGGTHRITHPCEQNGTVDVGQAETDVAITIYPNPAYGVLNIQAQQPHKAELLDMTGRVIITTEGPYFNLSSVPAGAYFVRVTTPDATTVRRIVHY